LAGLELVSERFGIGLDHGEPDRPLVDDDAVEQPAHAGAVEVEVQVSRLAVQLSIPIQTTCQSSFVRRSLTLTFLLRAIAPPGPVARRSSCWGSVTWNSNESDAGRAIDVKPSTTSLPGSTRAPPSRA